ncbi:hypothetical protein [Achromobacter kerstersii]|uniref:Uncharacterized protein n=1 Tax=Achromobacter kerstersii TaxID=1353890 RepID=A0A6S6ZQM8_9BURK|nr:hypothetical protein [Achromobacter kerstersii]CAB3680508.1 hypothetical protein LMG3441_01566 [Achromobacter kerstersii]
MTYPVLPFLPIQSGYGVKPGDGTQRIALDGGSGRYRAGLRGTPHMITATYALFGEEYDAFMGFLRNIERAGGEPFQADLVIDGTRKRRYVAHLIPGSASASISGNVFTVSVTLEVDRLPDYDDATLDYWGSLVMMLAIYGSIPAAKEILDLLAKLANEDLPHA